MSESDKMERIWSLRCSRKLWVEKSYTCESVGGLMNRWSLSLIRKDKGYFYFKNRLRDRERTLIQSKLWLAFMPLCTQHYEGTQLEKMCGDVAKWDLKHFPVISQ